MNKYVIAITGKGGTGKTALTTLMTKVLRKKKGKLLVIDADPAMGLANVLGIEAPRSLEDVRLDIIKVGGRGIEEEKQDLILSLDYKIMELLIESSGFTALVMGQPITAGCFCPANTLLRNSLKPLTKAFDIILIDCEAGLEQINRKVIKTINILLILSDASVRGLQTATAIKEMALKFTHASEIYLILNKITDPSIIEMMQTKTPLKIIGSIPFDPQIAEFDLNGRTLLELPDDSPSVKAVTSLLNQLHIINGEESSL
ncbi:MAG: AAA family ATPase [Candidatus Helarchaeota archaeon]